MNIVINGNLTKKPEIKYFESGKIKTTFSVAVSSYNYKTKNYDSNFFNCEAWDKTAELISEKFTKGENINVECRYKHEMYEKDGQEKTKDVFIVNNLNFTSAIATIAGIVTKEEKRVVNGKTFQYIKLADYPNVTLINKNDKISVVENNYYTFFGYTTNQDKKICIDVKAIFIDETGKETGEIVKFADHEINEDEIPF